MYESKESSQLGGAMWYSVRMKFLHIFSRSAASGQFTQPADKSVVKNVAREALRKYEKTFVDLARYDRGEKPSVSVSR